MDGDPSGSPVVSWDGITPSLSFFLTLASIPRGLERNGWFGREGERVLMWSGPLPSRFKDDLPFSWSGIESSERTTLTGNIAGLLLLRFCLLEIFKEQGHYLRYVRILYC